MTWQIVKKGFFDKLFLREKSAAIVEKFINLHQGYMSVKEYSLKFIKLYEYSLFLDKHFVSYFVTSMSQEIEEECRAAIIQDNMDVSMLMVHTQQVEDNRDAKKARSFESSSPKRRRNVKVKPKLKKSFSNNDPSNISKNLNNRGSNPIPQKGINVYPPKERLTCGKCAKKHLCKCIFRTYGGYGFGKG